MFLLRIEHIVINADVKMTQNIINMTPHSVELVEWHDNDVTGGQYLVTTNSFPASGNTIRLKTETVNDGYLEIQEGNLIPITKTVFGEPVGLPEYTEGTYFIVSQLVKTALPNRKDLLVPAEVVRDKDGKILGCLSFGI